LLDVKLQGFRFIAGRARIRTDVRRVDDMLVDIKALNHTCHVVERLLRVQT
jgi:hypothetical protein